ncbi:hypothetical protein SYJ56_03885 [Algoriphagus sp. D3-2-R+10]|uniref:hypothetical protein n=1 Tax=Algoriphagus aurantiacus TaxID=3103948 RepID=UPI002B3C7079|nr:hypothetical protein [Algoriphagus sp. D3-2-R+10]MEB2774430.1 hypothetical protein [Algoriphagus sp. D3-2-R+10]
MNNYAMLLEKTMEEYWGSPKAPIYFANYYGDKFEMRALLFSLATYEVNYKFDEYTSEELDVLKDYENKCGNQTVVHADSIKILELLANHKNVH